MVLVLIVIGAIALAWVAGAFVLTATRRIDFRQAFLLLPIALLHRLNVHSGGNLRSDPPIIYAILHQSRLDPALMLSLLPADTLHILDEASSRASWLEPWRDAARTIPFNPAHVFVSRRLVRHLKGNGRLAIYFPDGVGPETRAFGLYRAVARIALRAEARVVPVSVHGSRSTLFASASGQRRRLLARLELLALEPLSIPDLVARSERDQASAALFDRVMEADGAS